LAVVADTDGVNAVDDANSQQIMLCNSDDVSDWQLPITVYVGLKQNKNM
jgi:hypothetical protein